MTVVQNRSTNKPVSGSLSLGTKKKQPIYISENDPRANKTYLRDHPGEIIVLPEAEFAKWLMQEYLNTSTDPSSAISGLLLNDSETPNLYSTAAPILGAPGIPTWDTTQINYVSTDTGIYQNITIAFDPSPDDHTPGDGTFVYHVDYSPTSSVPGNTTSQTTTSVVTGGTSTPTPVTGPGSSGSTSTPQAASNAPVGTITTVSHVSTFFAVEWPALSNATYYTVTVSGTNVPYTSPTSSSTSFVVPSKGGSALGGSSAASGSLSGGLYMFVLNAISGSFSGTYNLYIQANYSTGSSTGVTYNVTI